MPPAPMVPAKPALIGDARRQFDLYDGSFSELALKPEEKQKLAAMVGVFPPRIDGFLIQSPAEVEAIVALRGALADLRHSSRWASLNVNDARHLLQCLRARRFNLKHAEELWRQSHAWRVSSGVENLALQFMLPKVMDVYGTGGQFGLDRDGRPVVINNVGAVDHIAIMKHVSEADLLDSEIFKLERLQTLCDRLTVESGRLHSQITLIIDLKHFGPKHLDRAGLHVMRKVMEHTNLGYFERAKRVLLLNTPAVFSLLWRFLCLFLASDTKEKTQMYSDAPLHVLQKYIADDQIPLEYGGRAGSMYPTVRRGGAVPASFKDEFHETDSSGED